MAAHYPAVWSQNSLIGLRSGDCAGSSIKDRIPADVSSLNILYSFERCFRLMFCCRAQPAPIKCCPKCMVYSWTEEWWPFFSQYVFYLEKISPTSKAPKQPQTSMFPALLYAWYKVQSTPPRLQHPIFLHLHLFFGINTPQTWIHLSITD